jgi:hypothetical protein
MESEGGIAAEPYLSGRSSAVQCLHPCAHLHSPGKGKRGRDLVKTEAAQGEEACPSVHFPHTQLLSLLKASDLHSENAPRRLLCVNASATGWHHWSWMILHMMCPLVTVFTPPLRTE